MNIIKENSPHLKRKDNLNMMMLDVIIALMPVVIFSYVVFQWKAVRNVLISVAVMELCEFVFVLIKNRLPYDGKKHTLKEHWENQKKNYHLSNFLTPLVSAMIFAMVMPASSNPAPMIYVALIIGSIFGMVIGKLVFGGTGKNIFNPAAVGMVFAKVCFGSFYVNGGTSFFDVAASGTALSGVDAATSTSTMLVTLGSSTIDVGAYGLKAMFFGLMPGVIGEVSKICILAGLIYLLIRRTIDWRIPLAYCGTFLFIMFFASIFAHIQNNNVPMWRYIGYQFLSGGLLFGATFMATDPVTSPISKPGRWIYGALLGSLTVLIRLFAAYPEGVVFSILLGNAFTCFIDYYKWSDNRFTWKKLVALGSTILVPTLIVIWALAVEVL